MLSRIDNGGARAVGLCKKLSNFGICIRLTGQLESLTRGGLFNVPSQNQLDLEQGKLIYIG